MYYKLFADLTVAIHFGYVAFVVLGVPLTIFGAWRGWGWVRNRWFRGIHLTMILVVVLEAWAGVTCPLTTLERDFRSAAGGQAYQGDFIANCLHEAMFFDLQPWVFTVIYTLFGALVVATLLLVPPRWRGQRG
ncbi:hypothetical protein CKO51_19595 [Rhodopirellula sp. SM50]|nr:DUF2784 domain-containing protein [Rhodopirellula sp. SM50]PAY17893.1 hypothetical protein CKO51_19595 [Rhodopirellula sp. SM50]